MSIAEMEMRRITEEYRRLREELLPVFRMVKESQPLPYHPPGLQPQQAYQQGYGYDSQNVISPPAQTPSLSQAGNGLSRKFSTKKLFLGSTPKNASPTHLQPISQERSMMEQALDPAGAAERAVLSSHHLTANGQSATSPGLSPNMPSPTSPPVSGNSNSFGGSTLASRSYRSDMATPPGRDTFSDNASQYTSYTSRDSMKPPPSSRRAPPPAVDNTLASNNSNASVEIFKSFRVSMEDPCWKVLPAALKKYNINAPAEQYALYIVYGDQERCLSRDEKPLILFKQLDKEGKKPMFMLRKTALAGEAQGQQVPMGNQGQIRMFDGGMQPGSGGMQPNSAGLDGGRLPLRGMGGGRQGYDQPGGII